LNWHSIPPLRLAEFFSSSSSKTLAHSFEISPGLGMLSGSFRTD
jgi:hypothetical protein